LAALVYLDTETTGKGKEDRLCQIAMLVEEIETDLFSDQFSESKKPPKIYIDFCKPPLPIGYGAMSIHHITNEMTEDEPTYNESKTAKILNKLNLHDNTLIIHNAPFDMEMLTREGFKWRGKVIDTLRCARHLIDTESHAMQYLRYSLGLYRSEKELCQTLRIKISAHDALGDVIVLYLLAEYLQKEHSINELTELSNKPLLLKTISFGKYKGQTFEDIAKSDRQYLKWLLDSESQKDDKNSDMITTINHYLASGR
jgi:exodeoxyribonuclease X